MLTCPFRRPSASVFWLLLLVVVGASFSQLLGSGGAGGLPPLRGALGLGADGVAHAGVAGYR